MSALQRVAALGQLIPAYVELRAQHPLIPARKIVAYLKDDNGERFEHFVCSGHRWNYTGVAYGGDDESYHGEGRVYCSKCGADGDA